MEPIANGEVAPRRVTARELWREVSVLLDAVQFEGASVLITRHGRTVALLSPASAPDEPDAPPDQDDTSEVALEPLERRLLLAIVERAPARIEVRLIIRKEFAGYRPTAMGARLAARLRAEGPE